MKVFIDTNILLDFYHLSGSDLDELQKLVQLVKEGRRTTADASQTLSRFCSCGVFNPARAERLFEAARQGR